MTLPSRALHTSDLSPTTDERRELEMANENDNEQGGLSTGKKALAGAAVGIAVPAAVTVAKKLLGNGD